MTADIQLKGIIPLMFISIIYSQIIPQEDPAYIYKHQDFKHNHTLEDYFLPFPFSAENFPDNPYSTSGRDVNIRFNPEIKINRDVPEAIIKGWGTGHYGKWSILLQPVVVPERYGENLLGAGFTRFNLSGRITHSLLRYTADNTVVQLGRAPVWWGQSWESSIIQDRKNIPFDHADLRINLGIFQLEILAGQLRSEFDASDTRIRRHIAGHRLLWLPAHKRWIIGVGEQIIYTGVNRAMEWTYINPFVPYFFSALEGDEEKGTVGHDNDNSIIFAYGRYNLKHDLSVFFEFILDDYQIDKNNVPHSLGWKLGVDGGTDLFDRKLSFETEFTRIGSWTYIHHGEYTTWQNMGHPIGYEYGPDCWSLMLLADFWLKENFLISAKYTYLEKGANTLRTKWASPGTKGAPFPTPPITTHQLTNLSLAWYAKYGIIEVGWSNVPFADEIAFGKLSASGAVYIKAQLVWGFGFDLE